MSTERGGTGTLIAPQATPTGQARHYGLTLSPEAESLIDDLARRGGFDKGEALKWGLGLLKVMLDARDQGERLGIVNKDGDVVYEITGF